MAAPPSRAQIQSALCLDLLGLSSRIARGCCTKCGNPEASNNENSDLPQCLPSTLGQEVFSISCGTRRQVWTNNRKRIIIRPADLLRHFCMIDNQVFILVYTYKYGGKVMLTKRLEILFDPKEFEIVKKGGGRRQIHSRNDSRDLKGKDYRERLKTERKGVKKTLLPSLGNWLW